MTERDTVIQFLGELQLFAALDEEARAALADSMESIHLQGGETLMTEGDEADGLYVVVSGRLRAFVTTDDVENAVGDASAGEVVGEMALLSDRPRSATVRAVRDCHLLRLSGEDFEAVVHRHPSTLIETAKVVVARLEKSIHGNVAPSTLRAIAVVPAGSNEDHIGLAHSLAGAMDHRVDTVLVGRAARDRQFPEGADSEMDVASWLHELEANHDVVVYATEADLGPWTDLCIRQADRVLLVGSPDSNTMLNPIEQQLFANASDTTPRVDLVMVHPAAAAEPTGTSRWLRNRPVTRHHHIRDGSDLGGLVRNLTGTEIGLVLAGGGARGLAHIGVIRALEENNVPVDIVGGTSSGSLMAGAMSMGLRWKDIRDAVDRYLIKMGQPIDVTVPMAALSSGKKLSDRLHALFGDRSLEDLWRTTFTVSANLTKGDIEVHRQGSLANAIRASLAIPGIFAPVRSDSGDVLVDGGIMNNLPIAAMHNIQDGGSLVAVHLRGAVSMPARDLPTHGHVPGWNLLWRRLNPIIESPMAPSIADILLRTTETGSVLNARAQMPLADYLLKPDVGGFGLLQWGALDELIDIGYRHTNEMLEAWANQGRALPGQ